MIDKIVIYLCKLISAVCVRLGGGSSMPGKIALKLRPSLLGVLSKGYRIVMVTGTNGKTTTSAMITEIIEQAGLPVINNSSGANMIDGITACFIKNYPKKGWAVLECDEAYTRKVNKFLKPDYMVVTNIFRDQLDRFGEVYNTWGKIKEAIYMSPETQLVLNGDEALFANIDFENPVHYFGFSEGNGEKADKPDSTLCKICGEKLNYNYITFDGLGDFYCPKCGFKSPYREYTLDKIKSTGIEGSEITVCGSDIRLRVSGIYNMYNALAAYAVTQLMGIDKDITVKAISEHKGKFGRNEIIKAGAAELQISLIKNPTGCDRCIETITLYDKPCSLLLVLNDNWGDGTDVSWVWDAEFEMLNKLSYDRILIGGTRRFDMAIRAKTAGLDEEKFILCGDCNAIIDEVKKCGGRVFALCTYTGMTGLRKALCDKGIVKEMWK